MGALLLFKHLGAWGTWAFQNMGELLLFGHLGGMGTWGIRKWAEQFGVYRDDHCRLLNLTAQKITKSVNQTYVM